MSIAIIMSLGATVVGISEKILDHCRQCKVYKRRSATQRMWK